MKRQTRTAWKRYLLAFEPGFNALMVEPLQPHEKESLLIVHDMLRTRASGVSDARLSHP